MDHTASVMGNASEATEIMPTRWAWGYKGLIGFELERVLGSAREETRPLPNRAVDLFFFGNWFGLADNPHYT